MTFTDSASAYKFYSSVPTTVLESRAQAIETEIAGGADVEPLVRELEGITAVLEEKRGKEQPKEKRSSVIMTGETEKRNDDVVSTAEYRSAFLRSMMGRELSTADQKIMAEVRSEFNSTENSGAILPTQMLNEVVRRARDKGGIISLVRDFHVPAGIAVPIAGPGSMAQWHAEGAEVEAEKFDTSSVTFDGNELMRIFAISKKVDVMSIPAFEGEIVSELSESILEAIAKTLVTGTGEGEGEGIEMITWTEGQNLVNTDSFTWRDILKLMGMLKRGYSNQASFACNAPTLYNYIYAAFSDDNVPVYLQNLQDQGSMRLVGHGIVVDDYLEDGVILYGDFRKVIGFNLPQGIALDRSEVAGFTANKVLYRGTAIADSKLILPEACVRLEIEG